MPDPTPHEIDSTPLLPGASRTCAWLHGTAAGLALLLGGSNLLIWLWEPARALAAGPGIVVMRSNTAVAIIAASLALALCGAAPRTVPARLAQACAAIAAVIGGLTSLQYFTGVDLGLDQWLVAGTFPGDLAGAYTVNPGRMSLNAALSLLFLGLALVMIDYRFHLGKFRDIFPAPGLALLAALPAACGLVGYLLHSGGFTGLLRSTNILFHTAVALFLLSVGILAARPRRPPVSRILSPGADGLLLRWLLPGSTVLLIGLAWFINRGSLAGFVAPGESTALMLYGGLVLLSILIVAASKAVARQEASAHRASAALREEEQRSRAVLDTSLDAVLLMDAAGLLVDWNPAAERIFGWKKDEVIGQRLAERLIPEPLRAAHYHGLARLLETGESRVLGRRLELSALRRDGSEFPVELSINALPGAERPLFVGFIRDLTNHKAAEEALRLAKETAEKASQAKDSFLAALSHELRTPLTPVLLSAAALRHDERLPADVRADLAMIERNVALEGRLIDDLLDLTRIARGKLALRPGLCDAHSLLGHVIDIIRDEARAKSVTVNLDFAAHRSGLIGDSARLQQVFWNLLKNAVKFTPSHGRIFIHTADSEVPGRLLLEVRDTGVGFTPEAAERLFLPFEQEVRDGAHQFGGLGLGLSIARAVVDLHGGTIQARSPGPGRGATFTVEFPGAIEPPPGFVENETPQLEIPAFLPAMRILLVEDHEPTLTVLKKLLVRAGHEVTGVGTVADAIAAMGTDHFDTLISDLGLPDGSGLEVIAALRARQPHLRAIALSGYGMEDDVQRSLEAGFQKHLTKPADFEHLSQALKEISARSSEKILSHGRTPMKHG